MVDLLRTLEAEAESVQRFAELLKDEQLALEKGQVDDLITFSERKSDVAAELATLAKQRNLALAAMGMKADRSGIETWLEHEPGDGGAHRIWSRVVALASEASELNRVNGELIRIRIQSNAQLLAAMQGASRTLHLYGPDGQTAPLLSRRINDAA